MESFWASGGVTGATPDVVDVLVDFGGVTDLPMGLKGVMLASTSLLGVMGFCLGETGLAFFFSGLKGKLFFLWLDQV